MLDAIELGYRISNLFGHQCKSDILFYELHVLSLIVLGTFAL